MIVFLVGYMGCGKTTIGRRLARRLGYDAYVVSGGVGHKDSDHAWVMIHENGTPYIYDVELEWGYRAGKYGHAEYNMYKMPLNKTVFSYQFP